MAKLATAVQQKYSLIRTASFLSVRVPSVVFLDQGTGSLWVVGSAAWYLKMVHDRMTEQM